MANRDASIPDVLAGRPVWVMAKGWRPDEGGMQTYARGVALAYRDIGARVSVFTQSSVGPRVEESEGLRLIDVGAGKGPTLPFRLRAAMRREKRNDGPPVLVHGTTWRTSIIPMLMRLPYFTTFHGREFMYARGPAFHLLRKVARSALRVATVSHYSADRLQARLGSLREGPVVAWNGVDHAAPDDRKPEHADADAVPLILTLCRLEPRKNISACVRAAAMVRDKGHPFRMIVAGRGPESDAIAALIAKLDLAGQVEMAGFVSDDRAAQLYREAAIFLHPQLAIDEGRDFEGFGIAIADAMSARTACIVGQEGGAIETVEHGRSGLIVDGRDDAALADAIAGLLADVPKRQAMADAACLRARSLFTWDRHVATLLSALPERCLR